MHVLQNSGICDRCLTLEEWTFNDKKHWWESSHENFIEGFDKEDGFNTGSESQSENDNNFWGLIIEHQKKPESFYILI